MADERPEKRRPSRCSTRGVHPALTKAGRQIRSQVPQHQLPKFQGGLQEHAQSYHQDRHSSRSPCGYR